MLEAEDDAANIKTISEVVDNQRRETEQLATAINQMSASIKEVANNAASGGVVPTNEQVGSLVRILRFISGNSIQLFLQ